MLEGWVSVKVSGHFGVFYRFGAVIPKSDRERFHVSGLELPTLTFLLFIIIEVWNKKSKCSRFVPDMAKLPRLPSVILINLHKSILAGRHLQGRQFDPTGLLDFTGHVRKVGSNSLSSLHFAPLSDEINIFLRYPRANFVPRLSGSKPFHGQNSTGNTLFGDLAFCVKCSQIIPRLIFKCSLPPTQGWPVRFHAIFISTLRPDFLIAGHSVKM